MRFCQTDGTPLVDAAPAVDPYKTMVATPADIAAMIPPISASVEPGPEPPDEVLDIPASDPKKTIRRWWIFRRLHRSQLRPRLSRLRSRRIRDRPRRPRRSRRRSETHRHPLWRRMKSQFLTLPNRSLRHSFSPSRPLRPSIRSITRLRKSTLRWPNQTGRPRRRRKIKAGKMSPCKIPNISPEAEFPQRARIRPLPLFRS